MTALPELLGLAEHARKSHAYWLRCAREGGNGQYGRAYCLDGAATWRRRLGQLLAEIRARPDELAALRRRQALKAQRDKLHQQQAKLAKSYASRMKKLEGRLVAVDRELGRT
jgi:hypothetical protein